MTHEAFTTAVQDLVRDRDDVVNATQLAAALDTAVAGYSIDRPRKVVVDVTSPGGQMIDLPQGFTDDSRLVSIEYPVGKVPVIELPLADVSIYDAPTQRQLALPVWTQPGDTLRVAYTSAHVVDLSQDTIPARHTHAVACLAASILCGQLSSYYAGESEPTISADTVNRQSKSGTWRQRQRDLAAEYGKVVGPAPSERKQAASATKQLQRPNALGGRRMFHPTRHWPVH